MAKTASSWRHHHLIQADEEYVTTGEDAALVLSLVIIIVLAGTLVSFLILEFLDVLPARVGSVFLATLFIFCGVVGRAILARALALPDHYKGDAPVMRNLRRTRRQRPRSVPPIRA
jgi:hypothetical protein